MNTQAVKQSKKSGNSTRLAVIDALVSDGPLSARELAIKLDMGPAGVRRHLEYLCSTGQAEIVTTSRSNSRDRGRPAKRFQLTNQGRERYGNDYKTLAHDALEKLRSVAGSGAIRQLAKERVEQVFRGLQPINVRPGDDINTAREATAAQIVQHFIDAGFATTLEHVGEGVQICQHHCPISEVAESCPEFCTVEKEALEFLLGTNVQRLSALSHGHRTCTTNIPLNGREGRVRFRRTSQSMVTMDRHRGSQLTDPQQSPAEQVKSGSSIHKRIS